MTVDEKVEQATGCACGGSGWHSSGDVCPDCGGQAAAVLQAAEKDARSVTVLKKLLPIHAAPTDEEDQEFRAAVERAVEETDGLCMVCRSCRVCGRMFESGDFIMVLRGVEKGAGFKPPSVDLTLTRYDPQIPPKAATCFGGASRCTSIFNWADEESR